MTFSQGLVEHTERCKIRRCKNEEPLYWCGICKRILCKPHWEDQAAHGEGVHVQISLEDYRILCQIIPNNRANVDVHVEHDSNLSTKWFAVAPARNSEKARAKIYCFDRYRHVLRQLDHETPHYPSMISFQGDTAAGKSSVIQSLLKVVILQLMLVCVADN